MRKIDSVSKGISLVSLFAREAISDIREDILNEQDLFSCRDVEALTVLRKILAIFQTGSTVRGKLRNDERPN